MIGKINSLGRDKNAIKIYQQTEEPSKKEGLWIKTATKNDIEYLAGTDIGLSTLVTILGSAGVFNNAYIVNNKIYHGSSSLIYYNLSTKISQTIVSSPIPNDWKIDLNNNLYVYYNLNNLTYYVTKINLDTNLTTQLNNTAEQVAKVFKLNNELYTIAPSNALKKYNENNDTYTTTNYQYHAVLGQNGIICNDEKSPILYRIVYGGSTAPIQKIDLTTGNPENLIDDYKATLNSAYEAQAFVVYRNNLYITFNNSARSESYLYKLDIQLKQFTKITDLPGNATTLNYEKSRNYHMQVVDDTIYLVNVFNSTSYNQYHYILRYRELDTEANKTCIFISNIINKKDSTRFEAYIGDGENWNFVN